MFVLVAMVHLLFTIGKALVVVLVTTLVMLALLVMYKLTGEVVSIMQSLTRT